MTASTATTDGPDWDAAAQGWADHWAPFGAPAREAVADAAGIGAGTSLLDVGCGSGELCALAAARGAKVSGLDAGEALVAIAGQRVPGADLRVGAVERLPWPDDAFDVVTAFNVLQFAADFPAALTEARRVTRPGGRVAVCNWGRLEDQQVHTIFAPLAELKPQAPRDAPDVGEPGVLEGLARQAGLTPERTGEVAVPYSFSDWGGLERALLGLTPAYRIDDATAARVIRETVEATAKPFRRADGSYWFDNRWRFMIAVA
jgi:SAM-dependent methyltransferase